MNPRVAATGSTPQDATVVSESALKDRKEPSAGRQTVLVVDDQHVVLELVDAFLEDTGYSVYLAGDGRQALDICHRLRGAVDLLLADVRMPTMSGPELYRRIGEQYPQVKALFMSGYQSTEALQFGLPEEAPLISKPFRAEVLIERLQQILEQESAKAD